MSRFLCGVGSTVCSLLVVWITTGPRISDDTPASLAVASLIGVAAPTAFAIFLAYKGTSS